MVLCSKFRGITNEDLCEFVCDSVDEVQYLPTVTKKGSGTFSKFNHYAPIGSTATVNKSGSIGIYMLFSEGWKEM